MTRSISPDRWRSTPPSVGEQTQQVLDKIDQLLAEAGTTSRTQSRPYLAGHIGRFNEMNAVWNVGCRPTIRRRALCSVTLARSANFWRSWLAAALDEARVEMQSDELGLCERRR